MQILTITIIIRRMHDQNPQPLKKKIDAVTDERIGEELKKHRGLQYITARALNIDASTICKRIKESPYLQAIIQECIEHRIDMAEQGLSKLIEARDSDLGAICFTLKTVGKKRGYVETIHHAIDAETIANSNAIKEQLAKARAALEEKLAKKD